MLTTTLPTLPDLNLSSSVFVSRSKSMARAVSVRDVKSLL